jgi:PAS domain S-box-containing protein
VGAFLANWTNGLPIGVAAGIAVGNTVAPLCAAELLRSVQFRSTLESVRDVIMLLVVGGPLPMVVSASVGTLMLWAGGRLGYSEPTATWLLWWIGDAMGVMTYAPMLLVFASTSRSESLILRYPRKAFVLLGLGAFAASFALRTDLPIRYLVLPIALWTAMRFEQEGATAATVIMSSIAIWQAVRGNPTITDLDLVLLQGLNVTLALTLLCFAAVMNGRRRAEERLGRAAAELEDRVRERTEAFRESEERLEQAQRLAHIGSFQWDADSDRNLWSEELFRIYGLPPDSDPPGLEEYLSFVRAEERERLRRSIEHSLESGEPFGHEYPIVLRDGSSKWVHAYVEVLRGRDGDLIGLRGTCQDVSERKRTEELLRSGEEKLRALLASAPDAMVVADERGNIVLVNDEVTNLLGYEKDELIGSQVEILLPGELSEVHVEHRERYSRDPRRRPMGSGRDLSARHKEGALVPVDVSLSPVQTEEGVFVFASVRDATERRRVEDALRDALERERQAAEHLRKLDAAKNAFLSAVSHELRTPLTAIIGFTELLQDMSLDESTRADLLFRVDGNAQRLQRLLGDLLDIDRLHRGILEPLRQRVNLRDLVDRALAAMDLRQHPLTLETEHKFAYVDPGQTERIVENLVSNAVKYTPPEGRIWVKAYAHPDGGVTIAVDDEGSGIPEEAREVIFQPFIRRDDDTFTQGTGIGLALVERFAALHGGRAWVEDAPGGGSSFRVELPSLDRGREELPGATHPAVA